MNLEKVMSGQQAGYTLQQLRAAAGDHNLVGEDRYAFAAHWVARTDAPDRAAPWATGSYLGRLRRRIEAGQELVNRQGGRGYVMHRAGVATGGTYHLFSGGDYVRLLVPIDFVEALVGEGDVCQGVIQEGAPTGQGEGVYIPALLVVRDGTVMAADFGCGMMGMAGYRAAVERGDIPTIAPVEPHVARESAAAV
jgi:hypothetical protein